MWIVEIATFNTLYLVDLPFLGRFLRRNGAWSHFFSYTWSLTLWIISIVEGNSARRVTSGSLREVIPTFTKNWYSLLNLCNKMFIFIEFSTCTLLIMASVFQTFHEIEFTRKNYKVSTSNQQTNCMFFFAPVNPLLARDVKMNLESH